MEDKTYKKLIKNLEDFRKEYLAVLHIGEIFDESMGELIEDIKNILKEELEDEKHN